jgi:hypothetical protein
MRPLVGLQPLRAMTAAATASADGTASGQACDVATIHDAHILAGDQSQLPESQQQEGHATHASASNWPALADASNRPVLHSTAMGKEMQGEICDSEASAALVAASASAAEGIGGISSSSAGDNGQATGAPAVIAAPAEDAAGRAVQQCQTIFSFL